MLHSQEAEGMINVMTRLEVLTLLLSIKALLDTENVEKAKEIIQEVIEEARIKQ